MVVILVKGVWRSALTSELVAHVALCVGQTGWQRLIERRKVHDET
jgi:hypothetical protein